MFHLTVLLALLIGMVWAFVAFRTFRIASALIIVAGLIWFVTENEKTARDKATETVQSQKNAEISAAKRVDREAKEAQLWSKIPPSQIELRDVVLTPEKFGSKHALSLSIKNLSGELLGGFKVDVLALDCSAKNRCEVIGKVSDVLWVDVPPQQIRGAKSTVELRNLPQLRGVLSTQVKVVSVYAGNFSDHFDFEWGIDSKQ